MAVFDDRDTWTTDFRADWLAGVRSTGEADWKRYRYVKNTTDSPGHGTELASSRLLFVTTSGAYVRGEQDPFDAAGIEGDTSHRIFDRATPLETLAFAHDHYDHQFVDRDVQSLVPLRHMEDLLAEGVVGEWVDPVFSFSGYVPDATRIVDEIAPPLLDLAAREQADGALLVPV